MQQLECYFWGTWQKRAVNVLSLFCRTPKKLIARKTYDAQTIAQLFMSGANIHIFSELVSSFIQNPFAITT